MSKLDVQKVSSNDDRTLPVFAEFDSMMERIRQRAHDVFCARGSGGCRALDDWLSAEREFALPAAKLKETDTSFKVDVALAGFKPEDITVTATPGELIIKAAHQSHREQTGKDDEDSTVHWSGFRHEDLFRRIDLPASIDVDKVRARLKRGMLRIDAKKARTKCAKARHVDVSTA